MVRLRMPLLSIDAHGSIGDAVTFQSSTKRKFAREKPLLPYSLTLNQQYQRWLYEDYCAYWHTLTTTQKNVYRDAGHRFHRTAFQQFMSVMLSDLPDIIALYHMDYISAGLVRDFSRNALHGTVIGSSLIEGLVDHAMHADGINDVVSVAHDPLLNMPGNFSLSFFLRMHAGVPNWRRPMAKGGVFMISRHLTKDIFLQYQIATVNKNAGNMPYTDLVWAHFGYTFNVTSRDVHNFKDGIFHHLYNDGAPPGTDIDTNAVNLGIGADGGLASWTICDFDHVILYNRILTEADFLRHSLRRYQA